MVIWVNLVICLHLWFCSFTSCTHSSRGPAKSKMKQGMWAKMSTHQYLTAKSTGLIGNYLLKPSMFILKEIYCRKIKEWFRNAITRKKGCSKRPLNKLSLSLCTLHTFLAVFIQSLSPWIIVLSPFFFPLNQQLYFVWKRQ